MALTLAACSGAETVPLRTSTGQSMHAPDAATSKARDKNTTADKLLEAIGMSLSDINKAVLDWCETQGGNFMLPEFAAPGCVIGEEGWAGAMGVLKETPCGGGKSGPPEVRISALSGMSTERPRKLAPIQVANFVSAPPPSQH